MGIRQINFIWSLRKQDVDLFEIKDGFKIIRPFKPIYPFRIGYLPTEALKWSISFGLNIIT